MKKKLIRSLLLIGVSFVGNYFGAKYAMIPLIIASCIVAFVGGFTFPLREVKERIRG